MAKKEKTERFEKVAGARSEKIKDLLRLLGNCANKNNYSYTDDEVIEVFRSIEDSLNGAKKKYDVFGEKSLNENFRAEFESGYTWIAGFLRSVRRFPKKSALIYPAEGRIWSYEALNCEANRLANAMRKNGVKKGDRVMYRMGSLPEFTFIYIACQKIGAAGVPIDMGLSPEQTAAALDSARPEIFFYENNGDAELALTLSVYKPALLVIADFPKDAKIPAGHITYEELTRKESSGEPQTDALSIYDETTLFYTSGTTGRHKCVPVTSINEVLSAHDMMMYLKVQSGDIMMTLSPWAHRGGLHCGGPSTALYVGAVLIVQGKADIAECLKYIERYKVTFVSGMPHRFKELADLQEAEDRNLGSLTRIISVGGAMGRSECLRCQRVISPNLYNGYGTTETFWNTILSPEELPFYSESAGRACADDDVRIVELSEEREAEPDETVPTDGKTCGEIIIKSYSKSSGYYAYNNASGGSRYYKGYLYTGDIGTWDENGIITVAGRNDDMIICGGEKIYPDEVEAVLTAHPKVSDCIVTSVTDENGEELIAAYIVRSEKGLDAEELDKYCRQSRPLANGKHPRLYRFKKVLPKTANGKKQHKKAKQMAINDFKNGMFYRV